MIGVALGVGAMLFPLEVRLPRGVVVVFASSPLVAGLGLIAPVTPRWAGPVLLGPATGAGAEPPRRGRFAVQRPKSRSMLEDPHCVTAFNQYTFYCQAFQEAHGVTYLKPGQGGVEVADQIQ